MVQSQPGQIVPETLSWKNPAQKRAGGVAQGVGPEFKPRYHTKNVNKLISSTKRQRNLTIHREKQYQTLCSLQKIQFRFRDRNNLKVKEYN
jgi:hypothetical protein